MNDFDLLKSPLQGTNLIEASAGTGKTFTITGIFLRLVLEQALEVDRILVVTFTRDATAELRDRIRAALKYLMDEIETPGSTGKEFLQQLAAEYRDRDRRGLALERLAEALRNFDQASISTIHGFCRRMLQENAFESASPFDTELITDQRGLLREVIEDFWRKNFYEVFPEVIQCAQQEIKKPENLLSLLGNHPSPARLNIVPRVPPQLEELEKLIIEFRKLFSTLRQSWPEAGEQVRELLMNAGLNGSRYGNRIPGFLKEMDNYLKTPEPELPLNFSNIEKFTPGYLAASKTKHGSVPGHSFFDLCEDFTRRVDAVKQTAAQHLLYLKAQIFNCLQQELPVLKRRLNVQFYDDLLLGMLDAIQGKTSETLIRSLREKYRAVLIDEFQDTDPIQYTVFSRVFVGGDSKLFLIGDPKQAIYGFRGADIFAYHEAAQQVEKVYTLRLNWRSGTGLVEAVNAIFSRVKQPFAFEWIEFHRAEAAPGGDREELKLDGRSEPPFQLWFMDADNMEAGLLTRSGFIKKSEAREMACRAVAAEISRLVNLGRERRAMLGTEPVKAGDIAVLVRRNVEAEQMQKALAELNIPSLLHERIYLFDTHEALEMERVLAAIAEPNNERLLKVALTTDILGLGGEELSRLLEHERGLEDWLTRFGNYFLTWHDHGFIRMFAEFISKENVRVRLLEFADGERRLTNLLHLAEVLHQHSTESRPGVRGLVKWLSEQRDPNSPRPEELKLRLETDEEAVKLVTIHKSKGLEYPIVFCPMAWDQSTIGKKEKTLQFHDSEGRFTLDLGSENWVENRRFAQEERLAENLRLLYVSLTRAKSRCYLIWGRINESWTSAPAYLFHSARTGESFAGTDALGDGVKSLGGKQIYQDLEQLAGSAGGCIALSSMPLGPGEPFRPRAEEQEKLEYRRFDRRIDQEWRISSFSSLVSGRVQETELPDRDALVSYHEGPMQEQEEPAGILAFPGGIRAGNFFHGLLERLDFSQRDPEKIGSQVVERLKLYGFDLAWENEVCAMLRRLVSLPLGGEGEVFTLSQIGLKNRLNELEFYLPLKSINPEKLKNVFAASGAIPIADRFPERIGRLSFSPVRGFLKGFMDLVVKHGERFYLVDWKSNYLGSRIRDYRPEALAPGMQREFYTLQYHLYTVALDRYLGFRMPGYAYHTHFGGVYYIFLRGLDPDKNPDYGLYYDLPPAGLIEELGKTLISDKVDT